MAGRGRTNIKSDLRIPLSLPGPQVLEDVHLVDQALGECREVVSADLRGRNDKDIDLRVQQEPPADIGAGEEGFAHPTERTDDPTTRAILKKVRDVVLNRRGDWEAQVLPREVYEYAEVL